MAGWHTDHEEKWSKKTAAHQAVMGRRLIEIEGTSDRHDGFEVRRTFDGSFHLGSGEVADADHADVAVGPGLLRGPFDEVVHVVTLLAVKKTEGSSGAAGSATVGDDVNVASRHEEIARTGFNKACGGAEVLNLTRVGRGSDQDRVATRLRGTVHIGEQGDTITHRHGNIVILDDGIGRLREVAILPTGGLRTVQVTLSAFDSRSLDLHKRPHHLVLL